MKRLYVTKWGFLMAVCCFVFLVVLLGNVNIAESEMLIVDEDCIDPCITGIPCYTTIQSAVDSASSGDTITVCPGAYVENVVVDTCLLTIKSYSQNPSDTIVIAADENQNVFYIEAVFPCGRGLGNITISGFTIKGATGDTCDIGSDIQPCAGIRAFCTVLGNITNNIITGNNYGINIKDTVEWDFNYIIEGNQIFSNNVGVKFQYAYDSYLLDNHIYNNNNSTGTGTGVEVIDTYSSEIAGNTIESNELGISLSSLNFSPGYATKDNIIYHNYLIGNTDQISDDAQCPTGGYEHYWYEPTLLEGNYWSNYTGDIPFPEECYDYYPLNEILNPTIYTLKVKIFDGHSFGNGTVTSSPTGIDCGTDCTEQYDENTVVTLTAIPDAGSTFFGWIGGGCGESGRGDCTVTIKAHSFVIATFEVCENLPVRIAGATPIYYSTLQEAYNAAGYGDTIQSQATVFTENLNINLNKSVTLEGGYDCDYTTNTGKTTLNGTITISDGTATIGDGIFVLE